ncbi:DUF4440 domain-containing protein [Caulobacter sp. SLTY]|uniref:YybH family protein n=1 Tax=Caulobacter sp. SLTY TaxID=2683262 RepID=UPI0014130F08|nr:nuclear transport factor 2 family protein [Caulobacter sp. SLTY]NBB14942.1 DUF4440 domain-containing protein [Caulobacter sp. SLTY]
MTDHADILAVIDRHTAATRAKDPDRALADFAPDLTSYTLAPPLGNEGLSPEALADWYATWRGPLGYETRDLRVRVSGDLALAWGWLHIHGTKLDGGKVSTWSRLTLALRRDPAGWRVFHEHNSVPFYMDGSLRAAVDLLPPGETE